MAEDEDLSGIRGDRDLDGMRKRLQEWARNHGYGDDVDVPELARSDANGGSSDTVAVELAWNVDGRANRAPLIARLPPASEGVYRDYDVVTQAEVQRILADQGLPVPRPVAVEPDPSWLGVPFFLMPRVDGRVPPERPLPYSAAGWMKEELTPEQRTAMHSDFQRCVAELHRIDWEATGLAIAAHEEGVGLEAELAHWESFLQWTTVGSDPDEVAEVAGALAWCRGNRPSPEPPPSMLWGDARFGNAIFDESGRSPVVAAMIDWEMTSIGPPELDLGWSLAYRYFTAGGGPSMLPELTGLPDRDETIAEYSRFLGRPVNDMEWYEAMAAARFGALLLSAKRLLRKAGVTIEVLELAKPIPPWVHAIID